MGDHSLAVSRENIIDPGHQRADFGVNAWVVRLSTALAPRDNALQLPITYQRTTRVTLSRGEKVEENYSTAVSWYSILHHTFIDPLGLVSMLCNSINIPDTSLCHPPGIQRRPCGQWSSRGRTLHTLCLIELGFPNTEGKMGWTLHIRARVGSLTPEQFKWVNLKCS